MAITKICDGYYYGTQEDLKPLLLGGAELESTYIAIDTGAIYRGTRPHAGREIGSGGKAWLNYIGRVNKSDSKSFLVSSESFARNDINYTAGGELKGMRFRLKEILENLLVKNSLYAEEDSTNGYTRVGEAITYTGSEAFTKNINVYADEVDSLAIVAWNKGESQIGSGRIKVGYLDDTNTFIEIKSVSSINAGNYKIYRNQKIEGAEAVPHRPLAIQITQAVSNLQFAIYDERISNNYGDWLLATITRYGCVDNIRHTCKLTEDTDQYIISDADYRFQMSVLKANEPIKFKDIGDNRYTNSAGSAEDFICNGNDDSLDFVGAEKGLFHVLGIAEVFVD